MFDNLLHSRKFWLAICDAFFSTLAIVLTVVLSPANLDTALKIVAIWQPVIIALIVGITVEDSAHKIGAALIQMRDKIPMFFLGAFIIAYLLASGAQVASASGEDFFIGLSYCTGQSISDLERDRQAFDRWYGKQYGVVDWGGNYHARMNEYARRLNCPKPFDVDAGNLTLYYRIFAEWDRALYP